MRYNANDPYTREYNEEKNFYEGIDERRHNVKVNYSGECGIEGVWVLVTKEAHDTIMETDGTGELFRATMNNDAIDGVVNHGDEVIIETRGQLRPLILGRVTMGGMGYEVPYMGWDALEETEE